MDEDLDALTRDQLVVEVRRLRAAIRTHRDSSGHALCWHHPQLWGTLPEAIRPEIAVPPWPSFLRGCVRYRESLEQKLRDADGQAHEADLSEAPTDMGHGRR